MRKPLSVLRAFLKSEASGGIVLIVAALLALLVANSSLAGSYEHLLHAETGPMLAPALGPMTVHLWINDGLMAVFFLLVGLEIKRELVDGALTRPADRTLPVIAAAGGMIAPALVFLAIAGDTAGLARGWAIPAATDIAFAVGVMALLGKRVPASLKLFLTTVAIVDDMGAVAIIALAYSGGLDLGALAAAAGVLAAMIALGRRKVMAVSPYLLLSVLLWFLVLRSGVHATVAGVLAASAFPVHRSPGAPDHVDSPLHRVEHGLSGWVAFLIVPLFGFANAGVSLTGLPPGAFTAPLVLAVAAGLFVGKQLGMFGAIALAVKLGWAARPHAGWLQIYGVTLLAGIGFTMSLFIGGLAFADPALVDQVKIGVLAGSLLSAVAGFSVLRLAGRRA
ncbi:Na+/H+ antiporter NhaA [Sphingomonas aracearum]|uniref:Na(+)/H(+) antiporter NhaA n=1 Tax=Sphingomonas aracearum TaxID=2283317 RepID=A0A369VU73_9SPHN|nr:Na+/H+ antiporter NhaA [Sphingomonas aracearum]RDE04622.1 Na+/H+ antiporter NhaA [Sphingomonas aracearum]